MRREGREGGWVGWMDGMGEAGEWVRSGWRDGVRRRSVVGDGKKGWRWTAGEGRGRIWGDQGLRESVWAGAHQ